MKSRTKSLMTEVKVESQRPSSFGLLPEIIQVLARIQNEFDKGIPDSQHLVEGASALGRLVTDSYVFSESPLGDKLIQFVNDLYFEYDVR